MKKLFERIIIVLLSVLLAAVLPAACSPVQEEQGGSTPFPESSAEPAANETAEPTAAQGPTAGPVSGTDDPGVLAQWPIDIDNDTYSDFFKLDLTALSEEGSARPYVMLYNGTRIDAPFEVSVAHAGMGTYGWANLDGREYLLYCRSSWYGGATSDYYCLLTVENGAFTVFREGGVEFAVSSVRPLPEVDVQQILNYVSEINDIWSSASLYFTTDTMIAAKQLYDAQTGRKFSGDTSLPIVYSYAAQGFEGRLTMAVDHWYVCREELSRLDLEFSILEGYDAEASMDEKLEFANLTMARNTAIYAAITAVNANEPYTVSIIAESVGEGGERHFTVRVENCPAENGTVTKLVEIIGGEVADITEE